MPAVPKLVLIGDTLVSLYRSMLRIRISEELLSDELSADTPPDLWPQIGGEAVAAGVGWHLDDLDLLFATRPAFAACIAKGVPLAEVFGQWLGKVSGPGAGIGLGRDFAAPDRGLLGILSDNASPLLQCVGAAATLDRDSKRLAAVFFRHGGLRCGGFHEAIRTAADWGLPVLFVGQFTGVERLSRVAAVAKSYGAAAVDADGRVVGDVYAAAHEAARRARAREGPSLLLLDVNEAPAGRELSKQQDPLQLIESHLRKTETLDQAKIDNLRQAITEEARAGLAAARRAPVCDLEKAATLLHRPKQLDAS